MPIPLYGCVADGNVLVRLDDASLLDDEGEPIESPHALSAPIDGGAFGTLRRISQRVSAAAPSTVAMTPIADGAEIPDQRFEEAVDPVDGSNHRVEASVDAGGSEFQVLLEVAAHEGPLSFGATTFHVIPARSARGRRDE